MDVVRIIGAYAQPVKLGLLWSVCFDNDASRKQRKGLDFFAPIIAKISPVGANMVWASDSTRVWMMSLLAGREMSFQHEVVRLSKPVPSGVAFAFDTDSEAFVLDGEEQVRVFSAESGLQLRSFKLDAQFAFSATIAVHDGLVFLLALKKRSKRPYIMVYSREGAPVRNWRVKCPSDDLVERGSYFGDIAISSKKELFIALQHYYAFDTLIQFNSEGRLLRNLSSTIPWRGEWRRIACDHSDRLILAADARAAILRSNPMGNHEVQDVLDDDYLRFGLDGPLLRTESAHIGPDGVVYVTWRHHTGGCRLDAYGQDISV